MCDGLGNVTRVDLPNNLTVPEAQAGPSYALPASYNRIDNGSGTMIDTNDDTASGAGAPCTLRDAIIAVNSGGALAATLGCNITPIGDTGR
jgi:CSLREA domain-containing protein